MDPATAAKLKSSFIMPASHIPGTPEYIAHIKASMKAHAGLDQIGADTNHDGMYAGKSLQLGAGGRSALLLDKLVLGLVEHGYSYTDALKIAKQKVWANGVAKYGKKAMDQWSKANH